MGEGGGSMHASCGRVAALQWRRHGRRGPHSRRSATCMHGRYLRLVYGISLGGTRGVPMLACMGWMHRRLGGRMGWVQLRSRARWRCASGCGVKGGRAPRSLVMALCMRVQLQGRSRQAAFGLLWCPLVSDTQRSLHFLKVLA